jgi:TFIIF-interacting CTD phosphatase-like protein
LNESDILSEFERYASPLIEPPRKRKLTIFLDLDSTLIYKTDGAFDFMFTIEDHECKIKKRPFLDDFLDSISEFADLYIYTSATKVYAENIFNYLNKPRPRIIGFFSRENTKGAVKNVSILGTPLERTFLIDDFPQAASNRENLLQVAEFKGEENDDELKRVIKYVKELNNVHNVTTILPRKFELPQVYDDERSHLFSLSPRR